MALRFMLSCLLMAACYLQSFSQSLYIPRNIKTAYEKGTRSPDGRPGKNYWQNHGRYAINITALPSERIVRGTETITYTNNSPDTLKVLLTKLILNIHKKNMNRAFQIDTNYLTNGIQIDTVSENGRSRAWIANQYEGTARNVRLSRPLAPHDSVLITFSWHYQPSLVSNREGMVDSTSWFLAYFYPRIAVYDDYYGWDNIPFTDLQEFYNDFNDYTLNVTVPKNYVVWATGTLQNPNEVLQPAVAQKLAASMTSDEISHIATKEEMLGGKVTAQNPTNTWKWTAGDITDVACAISDHFVWDASSVVVDDVTHRRASVQSAYNDTAMDYHHMVEFGRHSLDWLSHNWPGVPYPFPKTTIVQGFADMEYPMMVNDNTTNDLDFTRFVVEHEIAHTWFPFYMGINESRYGFMDEGWATTFELLISRVDLGNEKAEDNYKNFRVNGYIQDPTAEEDLPIITPANALTGISYGNNAYGKPSLAYLAVKDLLGDELFKKSLHEYMARWHGKHPIPWDFFNSINDASGKNLNWFWTSWFFTNNYIDLAIKKVTAADKKYTVQIGNVGGFPIPFNAVIHYADGSSDKVHYTPILWSTDSKAAKITLTAAAGKKVQSIELDGGIYVDATPADNSWTAQ